MLNIGFLLLLQTLGLIIPIATNGILTRELAPSGYGNYAYIVSVFSIFLIIFNWGVGHWGPVLLNRNKNDYKGINAASLIFYSRGLIIFLAMPVFVYFVWVDDYYLLFACLCFAFSQLMNISWHFQYECKISRIYSIGLLQKISFLLFLLVIVVYKYLNDNPNSYVVVIVLYSISFALANIFYWTALDHRVFFSIRNVKVIDIFRTLFEGSNYAVVDALPIIYTYGYIVIAKEFVDAASIGFLYAAFAIVKIAQSMLSPIGDYYYPKVLKCLASGFVGKVDSIIKSSVSIIFILFVIGAIFFAAFGKYVLKILYGDDFGPTNEFVSILFPIILLGSISTILARLYFIAHNKIKLYSLALLAATSVGLIFCYFCAASYGAEGVAVAMTSTEALLLCQLLIVKCNEKRV